MSYVPRRRRGPESLRTSHASHRGIRSSGPAWNTKEGVRLGARHLGDAGVRHGNTMSAGANGGIRLCGRPPHRPALRHHFLRPHLAAQSTVTQAAADGARAGIVAARRRRGEGKCEGQVPTIQLDGQGTVLRATSSPQAPQMRPSRVLPCRRPVPEPDGQHVHQGHRDLQLRRFTPLPEMPGLGIIMPSTISATDVLQLSTPTS